MRLTHSLSNTPKRRSGPNKLTRSNVCGAASGFQYGSRVIITAMGLMLTRASMPLMTARQLPSPPARPSGRKSDSWKQSWAMTGPSTPSISLSGSKRFTRSCKKGSTSVGPSKSAEAAVDDSRGPVSAESDRRGETSSGGPSGLLAWRSIEYKRVTCFGQNLPNGLREHVGLL